MIELLLFKSANWLDIVRFHLNHRDTENTEISFESLFLCPLCLCGSCDNVALESTMKLVDPVRLRNGASAHRIFQCFVANEKKGKLLVSADNRTF